MVIVALLLSLVVMLHISSKMADSNARLVDRVASLEQAALHAAGCQTPVQTQPTVVGEMNGSEQYRWFDQQVDRLRLYCQPDIDLKTTAQTLGLTQRAIIQLLKEAEGAPTFSEYVTAKRLAYACQLLDEKYNWNINAVAREAGILSDATFRRLFRKHYGVSPSEYRERLRHSGLPTVRTES